MNILPAIDLREGKVVRLFKGDFSQQVTYSDDPFSVAEKWQQSGAEYIHVVDLDGSLSGSMVNFGIVKSLVKKTSCKIHFGGGVRSVKDIKTILDAGVERVIIGTKVYTDNNFLETIKNDPVLKNSLERLIISVDCKKIGIDSVELSQFITMNTGWSGHITFDESRPATAKSALESFEKAGIKMIVLTDISKDGTLRGPNLEFLEKALAKTKMNIITSGGISAIEDVEKILKIGSSCKNLWGAIIGKALYENKINLKEAIDCAKKT